ncbi:MAG: hypothetical protein V3R73_05400 [Sphingomonadales bacterium]
MEKATEISAAASQLLEQIVAMPREAQDLSERMRSVQERGMDRGFYTRASTAN